MMDLLPDPLYRATATLVFALGIGMVALLAALAALAARRTAPGTRPVGLWLPASVGAYLTVWLALAITLADRSHFPLEREPLRLWLNAAAGAGPLLLATVLLFASESLRRLNAAMPGPWLIRAQTYRIVGMMFVYPYLYYGIVPAAFAIPAGLGDFVTAALAPIVARAVAEQRPRAVGWAVAWNLFGLLDLIVAPAAGVLSGAQVLEIYPLALIPLFIGPPIGILLHVWSLRNLAVSAAAARANATRQPIADGRRPETSPALRQASTTAVD